ncbi:helix-turn-helix domain-containing protein [Streptomyces hypolithicus]
MGRVGSYFDDAVSEAFTVCSRSSTSTGTTSLPAPARLKIATWLTRFYTTHRLHSVVGSEARSTTNTTIEPTPVRGWPLRTSLRSRGLTVIREPAHASNATQPSREGTDRRPAVGAPATFGQLLRARRQQLGLSLAQLASRVHFDRGHVSKVETDKRPPSVSFAEACDRALNVGDTFTTIATALEAAARQQQGWIHRAFSNLTLRRGEGPLRP